MLLFLYLFDCKTTILICGIFAEAKNIFIIFREKVYLCKKIVIMENSTIKATLIEVSNRIRKQPWRYYSNETNIRIEIVEPILATLGWPSMFLTREWRGMDYTLFKDDVLYTFIETKSLENTLNLRQITRSSKDKKKEEHLCDQIGKYLEIVSKDRILNPTKRNNVGLYCVLTNGEEWQILSKDGDEIVPISATIIHNYNNSECIHFFELLRYDTIECKTRNDFQSSQHDLSPWSEIDRGKMFIIDGLSNHATGNAVGETDCFLNEMVRLGYIDKIVQLSRGGRIYEELVKKENDEKKIKKLDSYHNEIFTDYDNGYTYFRYSKNSTYRIRVLLQQVIAKLNLTEKYKIKLIP